MRLTDRYAIVTGGGGGIGRAIALALAAEGATVAVVGRHAETTAATVAEIVARGGSAIHYEADVSRAADVAAFMAAHERDAPRLDILVNNAGIGWLGEVQDLSEDDWDGVMNLNVKSIFLTSRLAIPRMARDGGGRIINIASVAGIVASPGRAVYCASKGAVVMLTKAMAVDSASMKINVNAICPGVVETEINRKELADPAVRQGKLDKTPLGWLGQPEDIAPAAVYLASPEAAWVTGTILVVDGGWSAG